MAVRRALYRLRQFVAALCALLGQLDDSEARVLLSPAGYALFRRMARYDRTHALRVMRRLRVDRPDDHVLLQAALLHDVAKSAGEERIPLLYRGLIVLGQRSPALWNWLARARPAADPRRPFYLYATHAARGAALARAAGCPDEVVGIIAAHHDAEAAAEVVLLQQADNESH